MEARNGRLAGGDGVLIRKRSKVVEKGAAGQMYPVGPGVVFPVISFGENATHQATKKGGLSAEKTRNVCTFRMIQRIVKMYIPNPL